ncbi:MAG: pirin family protein [Phormidesmis sp.]
MSIQLLIVPEKHDLGGFSVHRSLPHEARQMVGPFIFFDHLGPAVFPAGEGIDVRPHPHINLATVTYLFEGSVMHRDSLGVVQEIVPGAVNWMTAGKGIVHSERSPDSFRDHEATLHAIQTWVALPESVEEIEPSFSHYAAEELPTWTQTGTKATLIVGTFQPSGQPSGQAKRDSSSGPNGSPDGETKRSPVKTFSSTHYLSLAFTTGSQFQLPPATAVEEERAIYSVTSGLFVNGEPLEQHRLAMLAAGESVELSAETDALCMVIGGEPLGDRYKYWNFVSSRPQRIEQARDDWRSQRFASVPGETEFIPLPDDPFPDASQPDTAKKSPTH